MNPLSIFQGEFVKLPSDIAEKLKNIRAIVSDWDGVFNSGEKNPSVPSAYYEADSMGTNLLRFALWKRDQTLPFFAIITGADNPTAKYLTEREHFTALYGKIINKAEALKHFCEHCEIDPSQVAVFFDDANDLAMAKMAGLRFGIRRPGNSLFINYLKKEKLVDYVSHAIGGNFAVREVCELCAYLMDSYDQVLQDRAEFSQSYQLYFGERQSVESLIFKKEEEGFRLANFDTLR